MNRPIHVALIGYGFAGQVFHAPVIQSVPGLRLVTVASSKPEKVKSDWPDLWVGESIEEVITHPELDLVVIATPNQTHFDLAQRALQAGKHVVVDKPFTIHASEARALAMLAAEKGKVLSVYQNRRWDADFLTVLQILQAGALGEVVYFESHFDRYRPEVRDRWREQAGPGSGLWYDLGPHLADQVLLLFGPPVAVYADMALQRDHAQTTDFFHVLLRYTRLRVVLHASALVAGSSPRFVIHGTQGSFIKYGFDTQEEALKRGLRPGTSDFGHDPVEGQLYLPDQAAQSVPNAPGDYSRFYAGVRDAILQKGPNPVPPDQAVRLMEVLEAAIKSAAERREISLGVEE
ncbi:oxidoreductase [Meiothermus hypogaeus]|uniref:Oxidoreductase n=2 Tax=Meiothermus hypogaeus TaxID=884155 RepID=A0A511R5V1_9DEIN|nr:oxidoreductase [Meiothermus hypogaeus]RIH78619.1 scyllo-inositol 2-dehydrogenase (NADP(+)) [Meiothermus hypogaeus]GEM84989.1 oxidoreductase [Meiothermus hypogaeus NBRC 106114]